MAGQPNHRRSPEHSRHHHRRHNWWWRRPVDGHRTVGCPRSFQAPHRRRVFWLENRFDTDHGAYTLMVVVNLSLEKEFFSSLLASMPRRAPWLLNARIIKCAIHHRHRSAPNMASTIHSSILLSTPSLHWIASSSSSSRSSFLQFFLKLWQSCFPRLWAWRRTSLFCRLLESSYFPGIAGRHPSSPITPRSSVGLVIYAFFGVRSLNQQLDAYRLSCS